MPQTKEQKKKVLEDLKEKLTRQKTMVFADFSGIKVKDLSDLRKKLKTVSSELKVAKKTLIALALKEQNPKISQKIKALAGEMALVFGYQDELAPAKTVWQFSQGSPEIKILGGALESQKGIFLSAEQIIEL